MDLVGKWVIQRDVLMLLDGVGGPLSLLRAEPRPSFFLLPRHTLAGAVQAYIFTNDFFMENEFYITGRFSMLILISADNDNCRRNTDKSSEQDGLLRFLVVLLSSLCLRVYDSNKIIIFICFYFRFWGYIKLHFFGS